jgi:hypothetical protein
LRVIYFPERRWWHVPTSIIHTKHRISRHDALWVTTAKWRLLDRNNDLRSLIESTTTLRWSADLLELLLQELYVDEEIVQLVGDLQKLPAGRYPQVIALALALRHSWRPDDLAGIVRRLRRSQPQARKQRRTRSRHS